MTGFTCRTACVSVSLIVWVWVWVCVRVRATHRDIVLADARLIDTHWGDGAVGAVVDVPTSQSPKIDRHSQQRLPVSPNPNAKAYGSSQINAQCKSLQTNRPVVLHTELS